MACRVPSRSDLGAGPLTTSTMGGQMKPRLSILVLLALTQLSVGRAVAQTCVPPPSDVVSWWPGDGNADDVVDGNPGTLQNGATFAAGMVGQGFSLDGVNDYVSVADATNLDGMARLTVDVWVRFDALALGKWQFIVAKGSAAGFGTNSYAIWFAGDNMRIQAAVESSSGLNTVGALADVIVPGIFYHVALTYDGSSLKIYLNGVLRQSGGLSGAVRDTTFPLLIGRRSGAGVDGQGDVVIGLIDEVEVHDRALAEMEIQAIFDAGGAGKCALTAQERTALLVDQINRLVATGVLNRGQGNALVAKLQAVIDQLTLGNVSTAINQLQAFINQVNAYVNAAVLSLSEAQPLLNTAQAIINTLGP